jgi:hypothetical protein
MLVVATTNLNLHIKMMLQKNIAAFLFKIYDVENLRFTEISPIRPPTSFSYERNKDHLSVVKFGSIQLSSFVEEA